MAGSALPDEYLSSHADSDGFTIINGNVLYVNPDITDVVIPDGVTRIAAGALYYSAQTVTLPDTLTELESHAFTGCNDDVIVNLPESIVKIEENVFQKSYYENKFDENGLFIKDGILFAVKDDITDVVVPSNVRIIADEAFYNNDSIKTVTISDGVKIVGDYAFSYCHNLEKVVFPKEMESIRYNVLASSDNIKDLHFLKN